MIQNAFKNKIKYTKNEAEYEESSVTDEVPIYFIILECGRNILNRLDGTYKRSCVVTIKEEYYTDLLETMIKHNDRSRTPYFKRENLTSNQYDRGRNGR